MSSLAKAHYKSPSPPPSVSSTSSSNSSSDSDSSSDSEQSNIDDDESKSLDNKQGLPQRGSAEGVSVPGVEEREYVDEFEHGDVIYHVGDVVHLMPIRYSVHILNFFPLLLCKFVHTAMVVMTVKIGSHRW